MFNLVVYSSTHSLVGGTSDAIIQGRATVPRSLLFHCSSSTTLFSQKYKLCQLYASPPRSKPTLRSSCSCKCADSSIVVVLKSFLWQLAASTSRRTNVASHVSRTTSPGTLSHCVSRKFRPNVCMNGRRRRATPRRRSSHFGQSIFCWYAFHRHHY